MRAVILTLALLGGSTTSASSAPWWHNKTISWWYAPDNNWPQAVALITPHAPRLVTSVMTYCGLDIADNGTIIPAFHDTCAGLFPALRALGVRAELATGSGNCSIAAMRLLWADLTVSPAALLDAMLLAGADGLNIDFEPQADNCKGAPTGTAADAAAFSRWLAAVRALLQPHGMRLTVDVASWSPVLAQYAVLAQGADRLLTMETYNADSPAQWRGLLEDFVSHTPKEAAGVGLGAWSDGKGAWWETAAAASYKVNQSAAAGVPELAVFRILPSQSPPWPLSFWWDALAAFLQ